MIAETRVATEKSAIYMKQLCRQATWYLANAGLGTLSSMVGEIEASLS